MLAAPTRRPTCARSSRSAPNPSESSTSGGARRRYAHFRVAVPRDAVAHIHEHLARAALEMMETNMRAEITSADGLL
jgi:hypothetical protein